MLNLTFTSECKVDAKGRILLPGKLKSNLEEVIPQGFIIKRGIFNPCLELWPMEEWNKELVNIRKLSRFRKENVKFIRKFMAGVKPVDLDNSGRLNIPNELLNFAGIKKTIMITSQINYLEIWDKDQYEEEVGDSEGFAQLTEKVMGGNTEEEAQ